MRYSRIDGRAYRPEEGEKKMRTTPDAAYVAELERLTESADRTERYRAVAELEDIDGGIWDGPRADYPPENWEL
jgi:hypothetical protein